MKADWDTWWRIALASPESTFFHSPLWHQLVTMGLPNLADSTVIETLRDRTEIVIPLVTTARRGPVATLASSALGCYGGAIAAHPLSDDQHDEVDRILSRHPTTRVLQRTNPFASMTRADDADNSDVTHVLDLTNGHESVRQKYRSGRKQAVRHGLASGVRMTVASGLNEYRAYFEVYQDSIRRWADQATSDYPWSLFEAGHRLSATNGEHIKLWLAELDGQIVAGAWCFYWNRHVVYWHGAALTAIRSVGATDALIDHVIQDACEHGYEIFDFNPSGGHAGVAAFKRHFGASELPTRIVVHEGRLLSALRQLRQWKN